MTKFYKVVLPCPSQEVVICRTRTKARAEKYARQYGGVVVDVREIKDLDTAILRIIHSQDETWESETERLRRLAG